MTEMPIKMKKKDFVSDQEVRWCPGCGDYAILSTLQKVLAEQGIKQEDIAIISGIGCSSRFPYYMNTYGMHGIHGRALPLATGVKSANPDLQVWVATGDGDALSIGGNHFIHAIRKNVDLKVMLFNNEIYGLTKGQTSPTSEFGIRTKSTPYGSIDEPFHAVGLALGASASFVARTPDRDPKHMAVILAEAAKYKGLAFVEILQNCIIFNDGVHDEIVSRTNKADNQINLEHGQPIIFGKNDDKAVIVDRFELKVVPRDSVDEKDIVVHDVAGHINYHIALGNLGRYGGPTAFGILRRVERPDYQTLLMQQIADITEKKGGKDLTKLLMGTNTWTVE